MENLDGMNNCYFNTLDEYEILSDTSIICSHSISKLRTLLSSEGFTSILGRIMSFIIKTFRWL